MARRSVSVSTGFVLLLLSGSLAVNAEDPYVYRSYQTTIYCNASAPIQIPGDVHELHSLVQKAIKNGQTIKAFGSRHSITDVICTNGIPVSMEGVDYTRINPNGTATFGAGIQLSSAMEFLEANNLSLITVPTYGGITIGGAIGTGAHGSSLRHSASLSDQIVSMNVITGTGSLVEISGPELDLFRVHLGLLSVIVDVTFATVPLFKMTVDNQLGDDDVLFDGSIPSKAAEQDFYQLWWFPQSSKVVTATGSYTSTKTPGNAISNFIPAENFLIISAGSSTFEYLQNIRNTAGLDDLASFTERSLYKNVHGKPPIYTENGKNVSNPATGYAWRLQSNTCNGAGTWKKCGWDNGDKNSIFPEESSMAFDISQFTGVMKMIRSIINEYPAAFSLVGIYIRFAKASPSLMAISSGRTTFSVEWATPMRQNPFNSSRDAIGTYQAILQEMVMNYGGRPHWGKNGLYYTSESILSRAVPNRQLFQNAMRTYDPNGIFLNAFGRRLLEISDVQDRDPMVTHCALQDYCTCSTAEDCAPAQICTKIHGFPACMDQKKLLFGAEPSNVKYNFPDLSNLPQMLNIILEPLGTVLPEDI